MVEYLSFDISPAQAGLNVEQFLLQQGFSKNAISRLKLAAHSFEIAQARVNSNHILNAGDVLKVPIFNQRSSAQIIPWEMPLVCVYEDAYFWVIDKPAGIPMYPHHKGGNGSLANILAYHYPHQAFHALNRLDLNTAGLVVLAKNAFVLHRLQQTKLNKYYLLYAQGSLSGQGVIDLPLLHINGQPRVLIDPQGKRARSAYQVLHSSDEQSLVQVHLLTGRTHQIRAHFSAIGHPLIGDELYGAKDNSGYRLLAYRLQIHHPLNDIDLELESPQAICF